jgi:ribulose-5-phosphate 4-epimerase/fuculose-1-phosphate aldolase
MTHQRHVIEGGGIRGTPEDTSAEEWAVRVDLAAAYRLVAKFGWDDLIYNHISARVPGRDDHFLINPFGLAFDEVTASSLVKIDHEARIVGPSAHGVNGAGFVIHHAVHQARPELNCVMHLHTEAGMALSMLDCGLLPLSQHAMFFHNRIGYHAYEGIALNMAEQERLIADLGPHKAMILRNHGTLTAGATVSEAFVWMVWLEKAARAQLMAMAAGPGGLTVPDAAIAELTAATYERSPMPVGAREWPALLRRLDREDPSYRN